MTVAGANLTWYVARSSGIVAWVLLSASVLWGLALSTRVLGRRPRPSWLLDLHRFLGAAAVVLVGIHLVSILFDSYVTFGVVDLLVPFASSWHPLAVAWGIVAFYLLLAVEVTSLLRSRMPKPVWQVVHALSFPLFLVASLHLLTAGTDRLNTPLRLAVVAVSFTVAGLAALRAVTTRATPGQVPA